MGKAKPKPRHALSTSILVCGVKLTLDVSGVFYSGRCPVGNITVWSMDMGHNYTGPRQWVAEAHTYKKYGGLTVYNKKAYTSPVTAVRVIMAQLNKLASMRSVL